MSVVELRKLPVKLPSEKMFSRPFPNTFQVLVLACPNACVAWARLPAEKNASNKNQKFFLRSFFTKNATCLRPYYNNIKGQGQGYNHQFSPHPGLRPKKEKGIKSQVNALFLNIIGAIKSLITRRYLPDF